MANSRWTSSKKQRDDEVNRNLIEQDNEAKWLELGEKVSLLKSVCEANGTLLTLLQLSEDINSEVKSQNNLLDQMVKLTYNYHYFIYFYHRETTFLLCLIYSRTQ